MHIRVVMPDSSLAMVLRRQKKPNVSRGMMIKSSLPDYQASASCRGCQFNVLALRMLLFLRRPVAFDVEWLLMLGHHTWIRRRVVQFWFRRPHGEDGGAEISIERMVRETRKVQIVIH